MTTVAQPGMRKIHTVRGGGGLRLHVREWGRADGPPILLIHGRSQNHRCWAKQYESVLADDAAGYLRDAGDVPISQNTTPQVDVACSPVVLEDGQFDIATL